MRLHNSVKDGLDACTGMRGLDLNSEVLWSYVASLPALEERFLSCKPYGVLCQTLWCSLANPMVSSAKPYSVLCQTLWCRVLCQNSCTNPSDLAMQVLIGWYEVPQKVVQETPIEVVINPRGAARGMKRVWNLGDGRMRLFTVGSSAASRRPRDPIGMSTIGTGDVMVTAG